MKNFTARVCLLFFISTNVFARQTIPEVTISNHDKHLSRSGAAKSLLTQQQFASSGVTSLTDALYSLGGLQLHSSSGTDNSASLSMRGFGANGSSNVLILINGIPLTNPDLMPPNLNTLPLEDIRQIEITAGSEGVMYGDQAVGGVINIITNDIPEQRTRIQCNAGSYDLRECHLSISSYYQSLNYRVSAMQKISDNYRDHNEYKNSTIFANSTYINGKDRLAVNYKITDENMQYPGALTAAQVRQNRRQSSNTTDFFRDKNQFLHLKLVKLLSNTWQAETNAFVRNMDGNGNLSADFTQNRNSLFIRPSIIGEFKHCKWINGLDAETDQYRLNSSYGLTDNKQGKYGIFTLANLIITPKSQITVGSRLAQQLTRLRTTSTDNTINRAFASTLGLTHDITSNISIYLRRADNFRFPKAEENTAGHVPLRTQRGTSYETGLSFDNDIDNASMSLFLLNLRDEIAFDPYQTPQNPFGTNRNLSPTRRYGLTMSGKMNLTHGFKTDGQINYVHARFGSGMNAGKIIPLVSELVARGGLSYKLTRNWSIYGEVIFTGKQFPANDDSNVTGGQGGYTLYNFNIRYHYQSFSAALRLNNISSTAYNLYTVYSPSTFSEVFYPAPERNITLSVHYDFA